jgi:hypothetical protein
MMPPALNDSAIEDFGSGSEFNRMTNNRGCEPALIILFAVNRKVALDTCVEEQV